MVGRNCKVRAQLGSELSLAATNLIGSKGNETVEKLSRGLQVLCEERRINSFRQIWRWVNHSELRVAAVHALEKGIGSRRTHRSQIGNR